MPSTRPNVQVQILHAELDAEEVPEGFKIGFSDDAAETAREAQSGGGKKRAAGEVSRHAPISFVRCCRDVRHRPTTRTARQTAHSERTLCHARVGSMHGAYR